MKDDGGEKEDELKLMLLFGANMDAWATAAQWRPMSTQVSGRMGVAKFASC